MKRHIRSFFCALAALLVLTLSGQALGQGQANYYEWDDEQFSLFEKGSAAFKAADYPAAIEFFKASLAIGEMNITLINLGRVYFKNGDCLLAKEIFDKVPSAPQVKEPSPALVLQKLNQYRKELLDKCPGQVQIVCDPINMKVSINGGSMMRCPREPVELPPGSHTIRGVVEGDGEDENTFKTKPAELVEIKLLVAPKVTEIIQKSESTPLFDILGWSMIVASGASLGASVFFHNKALDNLDILQDASVTSNFDEFSAVQVDYENDRRIVFALYSMTASTFVAGTVFLLLSDDDDEADEASIGLDLTPTGVFIRGQF